MYRVAEVLVGVGSDALLAIPTADEVAGSWADSRRWVLMLEL